jgi:hypothetical protein
MREKPQGQGQPMMVEGTSVERDYHAVVSVLPEEITGGAVFPEKNYRLDIFSKRIQHCLERKRRPS